MFCRDGSFQFNNGSVKIGAYGNGEGVLPTSSLKVNGNVYVNGTSSQKYGAPTPCIVAVGRDSGSRVIGLTGSSKYEVTGIRLPYSGLYAIEANFGINFSGILEHSCRLIMKLAGATMGHYYTETYDDYHVWTESNIGSAHGVAYAAAGTNKTLSFEHAHDPVLVQAINVRTYTL